MNENPKQLNILILVFSGTGNTWFVSWQLASHLANAGHNVTESLFDNFQSPDLSEYDFGIIGAPVYAAAFPSVFLDSLEELPIPPDFPVFLFATKGFYAGTALPRAAARLLKKGFRITGAKSVSMPGSDGLAMVDKYASMVKKVERRDYSGTRSLVQLIRCIDGVITGGLENKRIVTLNPVSALLSLLLRLLYSPFEGWMKNNLRHDKNCTLCRRCSRICPVGNITMGESGPVFGDHCVLCLRCIHQCPAESIQMGTLTTEKYRYKGPAGDFNPRVSRPDD